MSFVSELADRFTLSAGREMIVTADGQRLTYREVGIRAAALVRVCRDRGARAGDVIAVELPNGPDFLIWYFACFFGGFVMLPVNPELSVEDRDYIRTVAAPRLSFGPDSQIESDTTEVLPDPFAWENHATGVIFFTSGTTDRPKGVLQSWNALIENVVAFNQRCGLDETTRMLHVMPMAYMAGFLNTVLSPVMAGGTVVVGPRFGPHSALDFWSLPLHERVNTMWLSPSIAAALTRLTRDEERALAAANGISQIFCGTAPLHDILRADFLSRFRKPLQESYGTSEQMLLSVQTTLDAMESCDVGEPLPTADLATVETEPGIHEIFVGSRHLGYLTADGILYPVCDEAGRTTTGDTGQLRGGHLVITGRLKDLIIRGGINISPIAVENAIGDTAGIKDIAVVGVPHAFWGESIVACLEVLPGFDEQEIVAAVERRCRERLGKAVRPDRIQIMQAFPRATNGKIQKRLLRQELVG